MSGNVTILFNSINHQNGLPMTTILLTVRPTTASLCQCMHATCSSDTLWQRVTHKQLQNAEADIYNKSAFSYPRTLTTWHCPHSPAAAVATHQYILPAGPTAANLQPQGACGQCQVCCCGPMLGQTYGRTDTVPFHRPCSEYYAGSADNE